MGANPFADLIPQGGSEQGGEINLPVANPTPVTQYSIPASVGGADEMYDSGTAQGLGSSDNELAPGVVAVNPSVYPIGTIFKDADTGEAYVAGDKHGNRNPNVIDIYTPPSQYTGFSGQRNLVPVGRVPANEVPKTAGGVGELLKNFGKVPEGEGAYTSIGNIQQGSQPQQQSNPFADLIPKSEESAQATGGAFQSQASKALPNNPFADLIPSQETPASFGTPTTSSGQAQLFGDKGVGYTPELPWYKNLPLSAAAQAAYGGIQTAGGFERAGAAPVTNISGVNAPFQRGATTAEAASAFDKAIADKKSALDSIQGIVQKQGFTTPEYSGQISDLQREITDLEAQKEQSLKLPQYTPEAQAQLGLERQQLGKQATELSKTAESMFPALGVSKTDASISGQLGRGIGSVLELAPAMVTGPLALPVMAIQGGSQAYAEGYDNKVKELEQQGVTDQAILDEAGHKAGSQEAVKTVPALAAYTVGGALTTKATSALLKGATPLVKGAVGGAAAAGVNLATSGGLRVAQGGQFAPSIEEAVPDILFGGIHGVGAGLEAMAEAKAKAKQDAAVGGPAPEVKPSANPVVNEREAQILASANAQAPLPEAPKPIEVTLPAGEAPADVQGQIDDLHLQQLEHDEGSAKWNEIQADIDALKKPAEEVTEGEAKAESKTSGPSTKYLFESSGIDQDMQELTALRLQRKLEKGGQIGFDDIPREVTDKMDTGSIALLKERLKESPQDVIDSLNKPAEAPVEEERGELKVSGSNSEEIANNINSALKENPNTPHVLEQKGGIYKVLWFDPNENRILAVDFDHEPTNAEIEKAQQPTEEKPNAVQVEETGEVGVRNAPAVGEGVGAENKPEVPATEGEAPKEEVTTPTIEANGEGNLFQEKELPFNLAGETMAPEPEKLTVGTEEEQQLPMGEAPKPAEPEKPVNPYREIERRYYGGKSDSIKTHGELADAVEDIAKKQNNKFLKEAVAKYRDAMEIDADMEPEIEKLLADVEREANYHDQGVKPSERGLPKATYRKTSFFGGKHGDEIIRYLQDNKILPKRAWEKQIRDRGEQVIGGEYNDVPELPRKHSESIFGKNGEGQKIDDALKGLHEYGRALDITKPSELWKYIKEASDSALREEEATREQSRIEKKIEKESERLRKLRQSKPEKYAAEMSDDLANYFSLRRGEGGFIEFPDAVKDAVVAFGETIRSGTKSFSDWSKQMVSRLGEGVRNYLRQIWNAVSTGGGRFLERGAKRGSVDIGADERFKPKQPTERETYAKRAYDALTKANNGTPPDEAKLTNALARKFPGITSREASDLYATATGAPKPPVGEAAPQQQGEMFPQRTTGLKKAVVREERLARGLEDIPAQERQDEADKVQRATDRVLNDPSVAPGIVSRIVDSKNPSITSEDAAALLVERNRLMNERSVWEGILDDETKSPAERGNAKEQMDSIEKQLERLDRAQRATGSEWGRLGRMYQRMIREDYSLENMETRARRALDRPLTKLERETIRNQSEEIQKASEELQQAQEKAQNEQERNAVAETYWKTIQELKAELESRPKVEPQVQRIIERIGKTIKSQANQARERIRQRQREGRLNINPITDIADYAIIGSDYIFEGATDIAKFTTKMVKEFGEYVRPHIKEIFAASQKEYDKTTDSVAGVKAESVKEKAPKVQPSIEEIKARGKAEKVANPFLPNLEHLQDPLTHKLVYELARKHILDGVKGEDNVMKAVHNDIKDVYPDATERDVRRAFSEYGKAKYPSKEADRVALAELRTLTRLQESIDRLTEGLPALRTGLQRNRATQAIREKTAKLNDLLKKVKLPPTPEQLASRDAAKQTALRNRIADLDKQLRTGEKLKRTPTEPDSPETENLRLEKNAMEQLLKEVEGEAKPKKTPEEAYNERRQKAIDKQMAEIQDRIDNNRYEKPPRRVPTAKSEETQRKELALKQKKNEFERKLLKYQEENKPRWQKILQGTSEMAKGMAITGYHSLEKILGFDLAKMVSTPIEEFTGAAVGMLPGMKPKEGAIESGGSTIGGLIKYYKGLVKGAIEAPKVFKTGLSESEELFGKVRPNVARWYDWIGGRLHAALKHIPFTAQEELYRYRGLANAEKVAPGSTKNDLVRTAIYKAAYEKAQSAKLQEANKVAEAVNGYFNRLEQVDPKTGKSSIAGNFVSTVLKTFITKGIIKTPANYFKQVMRGMFGLPEGLGRLGRAYWNGIDNLSATEQDAIYKAFKVGGIGFAAGLYGYLDSFKDKKDRVLGGYYQSGRKEGDGDAKWGTIRINGHVFHYIAHNPVTEIMQFGSTIGRVQQALMKKTDMPTAVAEGFGKSLIALLGNAPVSGPLMRLGQPNANPIQEIAGGLVPALVANIAQDTDEGSKRKATTIVEAVKMRIPGLRETVPLKSSKPKSGSSRGNQ